MTYARFSRRLRMDLKPPTPRWRILGRFHLSFGPKRLCRTKRLQLTAALVSSQDLEEWEERLNRIFQLQVVKGSSLHLAGLHSGFQVPADGDPADLAMVDSIRKRCPWPCHLKDALSYSSTASQRCAAMSRSFSLEDPGSP